MTLVVWLLCAQAISQNRMQLLKVNLGQIQMALERCAVDTEGAYPPKLDLLIARGYLQSWPRNPYDGKPMQVLTVTDPPTPGNIVYVPCGPIIAIGNEAASPDLILPTELDQYLLAAYGPLSAASRASFGAKVRQWQARLGGAQSSQYLAVVAGHPVHMPSMKAATGEQLDYRDLVPAWELFAVRLTAGEDGNAR